MARDVLLLFAGLVVLPARLLTGPAGLPQDPLRRSALVVDAAAFDLSGRPVTDLTAADLRATIDGQSRPVVSVRYVFRGPEASRQAASAAARSGREASFESSRAILLVVDEAGLPSSGEKQARSVISTVLDLLGRDDGAALVVLPNAVKQVALTQDRRALHAAVGNVRGRAVQYRMLADAELRHAEPVAARAADDDPEHERQGALAQRAPGLARELATNAEAGVVGGPATAKLTSLQSLTRRPANAQRRGCRRRAAAGRRAAVARGEPTEVSGIHWRGHRHRHAR